MSPYNSQRKHINLPVLTRIIGLLLVIESAFMLIPFIISLIYREGYVMQYLATILGTAGVGLTMVSIHPNSRDMGRREAIVLVVLIWIVLSLFGMIPFLLIGTHENITDAFFETLSGFTTTGFSALRTLENVPHSILAWRSVTQWIGGMGIILFTLAITPMLNYQGGMFLFNAEVTGITHDKLRPRVSFTARSLWLIYIVLTFILFALLLCTEMGAFDSFCHALSIMSTGGFSTTDLSLSAWDDSSIAIKLIMTIFMFLGGVNFALIYKCITGKFSALRNTALKWYVGMIVVAYVLLCINVLCAGLYTEIEDLTIDPLFQAVSILSSTGLTEPDFNYWGQMSMIMMVVMMFTGACAGSTSGGAKVDRIAVLVKFLRNEFYKVMHPNSVTTVTVNGKGTSYVYVQKTLAFLSLYVIVILFGSMALAMMGMSMEESFFSSLAAISNTGIASDVPGLGVGLHAAPQAAKWVLSFVMLTGRLELFTVLLLFTRAFWRK